MEERTDGTDRTGRLLPSEDGRRMLSAEKTAQDFVSDAFGHLKYMAYVEAAMPLLTKVGVADDLDDGCIALEDDATVAAFVEACRSLRDWAREEMVDQS